MPEERHQERTAELRRQVQEMGAWVSPDGRVTAATAAAIVGRTVKTLQRWRALEDVVIPFTRIRYQVTYSLSDLQAYLDASRNRALE